MSQNPDSVTGAAIVDGTVAEADLDTATQNKVDAGAAATTHTDSIVNKTAHGVVLGTGSPGTLGVTAAGASGEMLYGVSGSDPTWLANTGGDAGKYLKSNGVGAPVWDTPAAAPAVIDNGVVGGATQNFIDNPLTTNTVSIGVDTYEFVTAAGSVSSDTNIGVPITAGVGAGFATGTLASFVAAINATAGATGLTLLDGITPALNHGTVGITALAAGPNKLAIYYSVVAGSAAPSTSVPPSTALSSTITGGNDIWDKLNLSLTGNVPYSHSSTVKIVITAEMLNTSGGGAPGSIEPIVPVIVTFVNPVGPTAASITWQATKSTGEVIDGSTAQVTAMMNTPSNSFTIITLMPAHGVAPLSIGDIVTITAIG